MSNNIEIEAKVILSRQDYKKVFDTLKTKITDTHTQTNFYIDSQDRVLKKNDIALRIREYNRTYVLTCKTPLSEGLLEKNQELSEKVALEMINLNRFPSGGIQDFLELLDIDVSNLEVLASLTTRRNELSIDSSKISLDENTYGNKVDYEIEVEDSAMKLAEDRIEEILKPLGITYSLNKVSKQMRAIKAITEE
ncbi:MAG: CYTH domain-containing protein [Bacilli bacterium]|nr:CYTH domain-containing protein [Bacilli bacterium]